MGKIEERTVVIMVLLLCCVGRVGCALLGAFFQFLDILGIPNSFDETYGLMTLLLYRGEKSKQQRPSAASSPKLVTHLLASLSLRK